jgi:hypothetical protein
LQAIVLTQQKRGVRGRSGIGTQKRLPNAPLALLVVAAAIRTVTLLTRFACNPTTTGLAIHHLKPIGNAIAHSIGFPLMRIFWVLFFPGPLFSDAWERELAVNRTGTALKI